MSREIPLTQGKFALVDDADYEWLLGYSWRYQSSMGYARTTLGKRPNQKTVGMHRLILGLQNEPRTVQTDHINGDKLDNRRCNLRKCTPSENCANRPPAKRRGRTSRFRGVSRTTKPNKRPWRACIKIGDKKVSLGTFWEEEEAARTYDRAASGHWGEFADLNFPMSALKRISGGNS